MAEKRESTLVRRKQIINAAKKVIIRYGSEHVTVKRLAEEIGVSEGAIYRHFKSKRDILSLLVDDIESTLLADVNPAGSSFTPETMERLLTDHMSHVVQRRGTSFQIIAEIVSLGDKQLNRKVYNVVSKYIGCVKDALSQGTKAKAIRQDIDLDAAATLFFSMTQGLVNIWTLSGYGFNMKEKYASLWSVLREALIKH